MSRNIFKSKNSSFFLINSVIIAVQGFLVYYSLPSLIEKIPFWMTSKWGPSMIADKDWLYLIPIISLSMFLVSTLIVFLSKSFYQLYLDQIIRIITTLSNLLLTIGLYQTIVKTSGQDLFFMISSENFTLNVFLQSAILSLLLTPIFIYLFKKINLVTDPKKHQHPAMLLKIPTPRGGGLVYTFVFTLVTLINTDLTPQIIAILIACILASIIGLLDDFSNTYSTRSLKIFGSPVFRLLFLIPIPVFILIFSGIAIENIEIPILGLVDMAKFQINFLETVLAPISIIFTFLWIVWIINLLSWSNGVDGQYAGIIVIASIVVGFLSLRFTDLTEIQLDQAKIAFISAGTALGILPFTWNPSKIMWGFGAISAGIVLAGLSILASTKISISILVLLIPFLDAVISIIRRIINKQNPLKGDRSHLHHLLLNRGWSVKQIAVFYWVSTLILGLIAYFSSEKDLPLVILTVGGVVGFIIVLLNLKLDIRR